MHLECQTALTGSEYQMQLIIVKLHIKLRRFMSFSMLIKDGSGQVHICPREKVTYALHYNYAFHAVC